MSFELLAVQITAPCRSSSPYVICTHTPAQGADDYFQTYLSQCVALTNFPSVQATRSPNFLTLVLTPLFCVHTADPSYRYQTLQVTEGSPKLPASYLTLAPLLFFPPLWRAVMDPVLHSYWKQWEIEEEESSTKATIYSQSQRNLFRANELL